MKGSCGVWSVAACGWPQPLGGCIGDSTTTETEVVVADEPTAVDRRAKTPTTPTPAPHPHRRRRLDHRLLLPRLQPGRHRAHPPAVRHHHRRPSTSDELHRSTATSASGTASTRRRPRRRHRHQHLVRVRHLRRRRLRPAASWTLGAVYTLLHLPQRRLQHDPGDRLQGRATTTPTSRGEDRLRPQALRRHLLRDRRRQRHRGHLPRARHHPDRYAFNERHDGVTLSVPVVLGLSLDDYYLDSGGDNELLGYGSHRRLRQHAARPSRRSTARWSLTGGVHVPPALRRQRRDRQQRRRATRSSGRSA